MTPGSRPLWQLSLLWSGSLLLLPVLLVQGMLTRRTALRLADGAPPCEGEFAQCTADAPDDQPLRVLGLGDSVIAGTGIPQMADSLTARFAQELATRHRVRVTWRAIGVNGDALADLLARLEYSPPGSADFIVVSIGVNDVTRLTGLVRWQMQVTDLLVRLKPLAKRKLILLGVPPMESFTALPRPLRWVLGVRAAMLDKALQQAGRLVPGVAWMGPGVHFDSAHLAEDGYHPNELACREMAEHLADLAQDDRN